MNNGKTTPHTRHLVTFPEQPLPLVFGYDPQTPAFFLAEFAKWCTREGEGTIERAKQIEGELDRMSDAACVTSRRYGIHQKYFPSLASGDMPYNDSRLLKQFYGLVSERLYCQQTLKKHTFWYGAVVKGCAPSRIVYKRNSIMWKDFEELFAEAQSDDVSLTEAWVSSKLTIKHLALALEEGRHPTIPK